MLNLFQLLSNQKAVSSAILSYGVWAPLVLVAGQLLQVLVAIIPGHALIVAAGYIYGFLPGLVLNLVCKPQITWRPFWTELRYLVPYYLRPSLFSLELPVCLE